MNLIRRLQDKPYEQKIRLLKLAAVVAIILIVIVWAVTLKFRTGDESQGNEKFAPLWENIKNLRNFNFSN